MNPGEYAQPLPRKTVVQCPVVSGYVTSRLYASDSRHPPAISGGTTATNMLVTFENVGGTQFSVLLRETDDRTVSGTRYDLMSAVSLVPGGQSTHVLSQRRPYLEVLCTGTTTGELRMQIDSQRQWQQLAFSKDDPYYPVSLWRPKLIPGPL